MKTYTTEQLLTLTHTELVGHCQELMWELGICCECGGQILHHQDEPFYTCQQCGQSGEAGAVPRIQMREPMIATESRLSLFGWLKECWRVFWVRYNCEHNYHPRLNGYGWKCRECGKVSWF